MKIVYLLSSLTVTLLPAYVVRCRQFSFCSDISPIPLTLLEVLIIATVGSWFVWRMYLYKKEKRNPLEAFDGLRKPILIASLVFFAAAFVSLLISGHTREAAGIYKAYFIEPALLGIVIYDLAKTKKSIDWVLLPLLFSGVWVAAFAIYQHFTGDLLIASKEARGRVTSVFVTSNAIGLYIGPLFFLSLAFLVEKVKKKKTSFGFLLYLSLSLILFTAAIYFSGSRGSQVGLVVAVIFFTAFFIYQRFNKRLKLIFQGLFLIAVGIYLVGSFWILSSAYHSGYFLRETGKYSSLQTRFCLWEISKSALKESPIFGTGLANFEGTVSKYPVCLAGPSNYPHNILLNFWVETGLVGLVSFLALVAFVWLGLNKSKRVLSVGFAAAIIYMFSHGIVDVPYFKNDLSSQFWVVVALAAFVSQESFD